MFKIALLLGSLFMSHVASAATTTETVAAVAQTGYTSGTTGEYTPEQGADGNPAYGKKWPNPRFQGYSVTTTQYECITDKLTGLMWTKDPSKISSGQINWNVAHAYIVQMNKEGFCGHKDWRLPNVVEVRSLINYAAYDSASSKSAQVEWLQSQGFSNLQSDYWTSTIAKDRGVDQTNRIWYISFNNSKIEAFNTTDSAYVLPVRGGTK